MTEKVAVAFFDAKPYDREFFDAANKDGFGFKIHYFENHLRRKTAALTEGCNAVCAFVNDTLSAEVLEALHGRGVKLLAMRCAGYNNVDLRAARGKFPVVRVPAYSPHAVAEYAVGVMLTLNRKIHKAYYRTRDGNFAINGLLGFDMAGKTAGIIGTGRIGRIAGRILRGFGMTVAAYDPYPDQEYAAATGVRYTDLDELYARSDVLSLHCPLTPETDHLINAAALAKMKDGVLLVNTGRGRLLDSKALIGALKSGKVGAAALDVYEEEGDYFFEDLSSRVLSDDVLARLLTFPNVLITSHQGFFTREAVANIAQTTLENIRDFFAGRPLKNEIKPPE